MHRTNLNALATMIGDDAAANGWSDRYFELIQNDDFPGLLDHIGAKLALITSEASEALEVLRDATKIEDLVDPQYDGAENKPVGFDSELADIIIRTLHLAHLVGADINGAVEEKIVFNRTRGFRHGGRKL